MNTTKLVAFLLVLVSFAGLMFVAFASIAGPVLLRDEVPVPPPLGKAGPGCVSALMFMIWSPLAALPGLGGIGIWFLSIRKQEAAADREASSFAEQESIFQRRLDGLSRRLLACGGDATFLSAELPIWTRDLNGLQQSRLLGVLAESSAGNMLGSIGATAPSSAEFQSEKGRSGCARILGLGLFVFAGFSALWAGLVMFVQLRTSVSPIQGFEPNSSTAAFGAMGCFIPGFAALTGAIVLRWILKLEAGRQKRRETLRERARDVMLDGCLNRVGEMFSQARDLAAEEKSVVARLTRADIVYSLAQLDGPRKGRMVAELHARGHLPFLSLGRIDLRGADLEGANLSGLALPGADLSESRLTGACIQRANLSGTYLQGADLRGADAAEANLSQADLREARLHQCILRQADLRGADLQGANLWQADLSGADLANARITSEQLRAALMVGALNNERWPSGAQEASS